MAEQDSIGRQMYTCSKAGQNRRWRSRQTEQETVTPKTSASKHTPSPPRPHTNTHSPTNRQPQAQTRRQTDKQINMQAHNHTRKHIHTQARNHTRKQIHTHARTHTTTHTRRLKRSLTARGREGRDGIAAEEGAKEGCGGTREATRRAGQEP